MDRVVRHAIQQGIAPMNAIQMATLNTAEHFGVATDVGQLAPGRWGDVLLVSDLENLEIDEVIAKGEQVARDRKLSVAIPTYNYPDWAKQSVNVQRELTPEDFKIHTQAGDAVIANVIGVIENQAPTQHLKLEVTPADGQIQVDKERDIAKIALVERHKATGAVQVALVHGFGFTEPCGLATTVAHDSHHMIVVGTDEHSMAIAANWLVEIGGGQVIVKDGEVIGQVELPIAGLMSDETAEIVAEKAESVLAGFRACGCTLNNPNMQMSLLALVVIPALRISDLGLVDVNAFEFIKLIDDELMA
jgi:adenine deaminase